MKMVVIQLEVKYWN